MDTNYKKTTRKSRRLADAARTEALTERLSQEMVERPGRKPIARAGYVSKNTRNLLRDATKTKGLPFSRCVVVRFMPDPMGGEGMVRIQNKADRSGRVHTLMARAAAHLIPDSLHEAMGI